MSRRVWPVGAVSNTIWSKLFPTSGFPISPVNSSNAAISTVQEPDSPSSMLRSAASGKIPRIGPITRSR